MSFKNLNLKIDNEISYVDEIDSDEQKTITDNYFFILPKLNIFQYDSDTNLSIINENTESDNEKKNDDENNKYNNNIYIYDSDNEFIN